MSVSYHRERLYSRLTFGDVLFFALRRKKEAREVHKRSEFAQKVHGIRAKLYQKKRFKEKATMRKT